MRFVLIVAALVVGALVLAGCSSYDPPAEIPAQEHRDAKVFTKWYGQVCKLDVVFADGGKFHDPDVDGRICGR